MREPLDSMSVKYGSVSVVAVHNNSMLSRRGHNESSVGDGTSNIKRSVTVFIPVTACRMTNQYL